jgi:hypothetical protein
MLDFVERTRRKIDEFSQQTKKNEGSKDGVEVEVTIDFYNFF